MDINGLVVSSSETVQLENEEGLLLSVYNEVMDIYFCILAHGISIDLWKSVKVNHCYEITNLKIGVLETCSGLKKFLFKTTGTSGFQQIESHRVIQFEIADRLKSLIAVLAPCFSVGTESKCEFQLISYQGLVTKTKESRVFELDKKILLFTTFNSAVPSNYIKTGSEIFISNVHLIKSDQKIILLCCGSSSVRVISNRSVQMDQAQEEKSTNIHEDNFCLRYSLSIYDFLWFERLSIRLKMKFSTSIAEEEISVSKNIELLDNIIEFFLSFKKEPSAKKKLSLVEEFFSNPHECMAFTESRLPVNYDVPYLSDVIEESIENISWINISKNWKISISNHNNLILIGLLTFSSNGNFYVCDATGSLPLVFNQECPYCLHVHNVIHDFDNTDYAAIVAICEYDLIFENIYCQTGSWHCTKYLRTSCCRLFHLASFYNSNKSHCLYKRKTILDPQVTESSIENLEKFKYLKLSNSSSTSFQHFLMLHKIITKQENAFVLCGALILILPEKSFSVDNSFLTSTVTDEDSFNFYQTDDDFEFANLITKFTDLSIENKPKLVCLSFKSASICYALHPGHIYIADFKSVNMQEKSSVFQSNIEVFPITASTDLKVTHDHNCLANYNLDEIEAVKYVSVKEILLSRKIPSGAIVQGIIIDKFYEDSNTSNNKTKLNLTICLKISDTVSSDTILVYVPYVSECLIGMLPGSFLEFYGFLCLCSKKGNLYIKASSTFAVEIKNNQKIANTTGRNPMNNEIISLQGLPELPLIESNSFFAPFRSMFFVVKIISAEVFTICTKCHKTFKEYCSCLFLPKAKIKASALIDDGRQLVLSACSGKTARVVLGIDESEWRCIASYVEQHHMSLKFSEKMHPIQVSYLPIMNQVFYYYCTSKATCQHLFLECVYILNIDIHMADVPSVWCKRVIKYESGTVMSELYTKLKKTYANQ